MIISSLPEGRTEDVDTDIPHVRTGDMIMAPLRRSTVEALMEHIDEKRTDGHLFPGNRSALARRLARGLQRPSRNAGIGRRVYPHVFRRMRVQAFVEAGVGPDVVMNALGWTRELGMVRGRRPPGDTLVVAAEVLREEGEVELEVGSKELTEMLVGYVLGG